MLRTLLVILLIGSGINVFAREVGAPVEAAAPVISVGARQLGRGHRSFWPQRAADSHARACIERQVLFHILMSGHLGPSRAFRTSRGKQSCEQVRRASGRAEGAGG